jgi:hypothetical protein
MQPEEIFEPLEMAEDLMSMLEQNLPSAPAKAVEVTDKPVEPAPPAPNKWDDLNYRLQMKRAEVQNDPISPQHRWTKVDPTPDPGWGHGAGLEPL